jgi:hypothetical protein
MVLIATVVPAQAASRHARVVGGSPVTITEQFVGLCGHDCWYSLHPHGSALRAR